MALNLPKPVHSYAGEDELKNVNANGTAATVEDDEDIGEYRPPRMSDKYLKGIIYPPMEMRSELVCAPTQLTSEIIDKTAMAVAKTSKPQVLEDKIRESQTTDPRFAFLNDEDPYYQYYKWKVESTREDMEDQAKGLKPANGTPGGGSTPAPAAAPPINPELVGYEPKAWEFKVDLPGVTAQDLDILRLTALFHARRGRSFLSALSVREGRNYQFDFLRPTHSLYGYYNRMVESYQKIMQPAAGQIEEIIRTDNDPEAKWKTLAESRKRALWEEGQRARNSVKEAEKKEEEEALAVIDWQDFVTVETIEFTQADMELDLPPPSSNDKLKEMSMAERRMAAMIMEEPAAPAGAGDDEMELEEDEEDEEARIERVKAEREQQRTRDVQRAALEKKGVKIKKDYVPKGESRTKGLADNQVFSAVGLLRPPSARTVGNLSPSPSCRSTFVSSCSTHDGRTRSASSRPGGSSSSSSRSVRTFLHLCATSLRRVRICSATRRTRRRASCARRRRSGSARSARRLCGTVTPLLRRGHRRRSRRATRRRTRSARRRRRRVLPTRR